MFRFAAVFVALLAIATAAPINDLESILRQATNETIEPSAAPAPPAPNGTPTVTAQPTQTAKASSGAIPASPGANAPNSPATGTAPVAGATPAAVTGNQAIPSPTASFSPEMEASAEPENTAPPCFPATATVELENGSFKKMADVVVGDRVNVGKGQFSEVFMFTHKMASVKYDFVQLKTASGAVLRLTDGHFLPVNGQYVPAKVASVGDSLILADGSVSNIVDIETVKDTGLFNPQTTHGDIVVDGVQASTYTTAVEPNMAHALLAPLRTICNRFGAQVRFLESGMNAVRGIASISA